MKKLILAAVLISAPITAPLAACGRMADLEAPITRRETERAPRGSDALETLPEPATINRPSSQQPIDGGPSNPIGGTAAQRPY